MTHYPPVPSYVDVSHYRAPFKNAYLGAVDQAPPTIQPTDPATGALLEKRDGAYYFRPAVREAAMKVLGNMRVIFMSDDRVGVEPYTVQELQAMQQSDAAKQQMMAIQATRWIDKKLEEGKVIFAPTFILQPVANRELAAIDASDKAAVKLAASTPYAAILAEPSAFGRLGWLGAVVLGSIAVGGAIYVARRASRRRGKPISSPDLRKAIQRAREDMTWREEVIAGERAKNRL